MPEDDYTSLERAQIHAIEFAYSFGTNMLLYSSLINLVNDRISYETEKDELKRRIDEQSMLRTSEISENIASIDTSLALIASDQVSQGISA